MVDICEKAGVQFLYSTFARQLVRPDNAGRVEGVIVEDENGDYKKITASKAVLLATGDYASNAEMMSYYVPWSDRFMSIFPTSTPRVRRRTRRRPADGMWIGAKMEDGPHAPMTHHLGGPLGMDAFLLVDINGERFMNEDALGASPARPSCICPRRPPIASGALIAPKQVGPGAHQLPSRRILHDGRGYRTLGYGCRRLRHRQGRHARRGHLEARLAGGDYRHRRALQQDVRSRRGH